MLASITIGTSTITCSKGDLRPRRLVHNKNLYLTVTYFQKYIPLAPIDHRLGMNICPQRIVKRLGIKESQILTPLNHIRAYNNSKRLLLGIILLPVYVDFVEKNVEFLVPEILTTFNVLFRHPWLRKHEVFLSIVHKKVKGLIQGHVVTI